MSDESKIEERHVRLVTDEASVPPSLPEPDVSVSVDFGERYEILAPIGRGGTGQVFKVRDRELDQTFAIKVLKKELLTDAQTVKRFINEANAAAGLSHSAVVSVYGHGETKDGSPYIVMNYIEGESLSAILKREGALDGRRVLDLFLQICEGLEHAHAQGLVHRDLKPSNIIVNRSLEGVESAYVVDFGIAKVIATRGDTMNTLTASGDFFGTPMYMSPEQCLGQNVDSRSDIYALGCILFETLTGKAPFAGASTVETIARKIGEEFPVLSSPDVLPGLSLVVASCTGKNPSDRYPTVQALKQDLISVGRGQMPLNAGNKAGNDPVMLGKRFAAFLIDWVIVSSLTGVINTVVMIFALLLSQILFGTATSEFYGVFMMVFAYILLPVSLMCAYFILLEPIRGQTFGKQLLGLTVCDQFGRKISFKRSAQRQFLKVSILVFLPLAGAFGFIESSSMGAIMLLITWIMSMLIVVRFIVARKQLPWDVLSGCQVRRK